MLETAERTEVIPETGDFFSPFFSSFPKKAYNSFAAGFKMSKKFKMQLPIHLVIYAARCQHMHVDRKGIQYGMKVLLQKVKGKEM